MSFTLVPMDVAHILDITLGGWDDYVKFEWPSLDNMASILDITRKFFGNPNMTFRRVLKRKMSPLCQLYFDLVHKMITP